MADPLPSPDVVARLAGARVLVVGDAMLDRFVHGQVRRISPEAPIPVFTIEGETSLPGGAANVALNVAALGARAVFVAVVGADAEGAALVELLGHDGRIAPHLVIAAGRTTTVKTRYVAGPQHQQVLRADREVVAAIDPATEERVGAFAEAALGEVDVVVLSDYAKGLLTPALARRIIAAAARAGRPVLVDPKGSDAERYAGAAVLTPNRAELAAIAGHALEDDDAVAAAARAVLERAGLAAVLVTRGAEGVSLVPRNGDVLHIPARAREVFDVAGAGDTVIATLAAALGAGLELPAAARLANAAAGVVVGKAGTAVVRPDELVAALNAVAADAAEAKIVDVASARERVASWRRHGQRIAFTNGCFDLLHPGHVGLLAQAKAAGDRLVIGLNSDASVARLKGPGRPVQGQAARALVLAALAAVDLVVAFDDDTPVSLIGALRPEVLVKGADYRLDQVVGADLVRGWGGRVVLAELVPGHSTTATIARLAR